MAIQFGDKSAPPRVIGEEDYRYYTSLDWKTGHTTRLRAALDDDKLCCAFDANREGGGCWLIARLIPTQIRYQWGTRGHFSEVTDVPFLIDEWRDTDGTPRSITDPRLYGMLMRCDTRQDRYAPKGRDLDAERLKSQQAIRDIASQESVRRAFARLADETGATRHRKLGTDGGKISTTQIWRTGAGGTPTNKPTLYTAQGTPAAL